MKCLFCNKGMVGFHVCDSSVQNMRLRPDGLERMGVVTFGAQVTCNCTLHPSAATAHAADCPAAQPRE